ncbi:hypothetical protein BJ912DRAFT_1086961 [Pholiota molesta]|nr:hypothetical protein BJ912DRAFT_1086961 [Pholiota molesta]
MQMQICARATTWRHRSHPRPITLPLLPMPFRGTPAPPPIRPSLLDLHVQLPEIVRASARAGGAPTPNARNIRHPHVHVRPVPYVNRCATSVRPPGRWRGWWVGRSPIFQSSSSSNFQILLLSIPEHNSIAQNNSVSTCVSPARAKRVKEELRRPDIGGGGARLPSRLRTYAARQVPRAAGYTADINGSTAAEGAVSYPTSRDRVVIGCAYVLSTLVLSSTEDGRRKAGDDASVGMRMLTERALAPLGNGGRLQTLVCCMIQLLCVDRTTQFGA